MGAQETELGTMAADPEIQNELRQISEEFSVSNADGLEENFLELGGCFANIARNDECA